MQDGGMAQRVADGDIAVQSHGHKYAWLHGGEGMDEEHLSQADNVPNLMSKIQEHCEGFRCSGGGQDQVNSSEHGQEEVHGLMQGWVSPDDEANSHVAH